MKKHIFIFCDKAVEIRQYIVHRASFRAGSHCSGPHPEQKAIRSETFFDYYEKRFVLPCSTTSFSLPKLALQQNTINLHPSNASKENVWFCSRCTNKFMFSDYDIKATMVQPTMFREILEQSPFKQS